MAGLTFNPTIIPISAFECESQGVLNKEISTATVNFKILGDSRFIFGNDIFNTIRYTLTLDPGRQKVRAVFHQGSDLSTITEEMKIGMKPESRMYRIKLPTCIEDSLTPIILQLNYTLMGEPIPRANNIRAVLKKDDLNELVVGLNSEINATVFIRNDGEDSYSTNLTFIHPSSLSYRRYIIVQTNRKYVILKCTSPSGTEEVPVRNTTCSINHPIFRSMAEDMVYQMELPVKYAINVFINNLDTSTKYVNFSAGQEDGTQIVEHHYEMKNMYLRNVSVSVTFYIPIICVPGTNTPGSKEFVEQLSKQPVLDCSVAACKTITCNVSSLEFRQLIEFKIKGNIGFKWLSQVKTTVEFLKGYNYLPLVVGSSVIGVLLLVLIVAILYKLGFFKRQYKQMIDEAHSEVAGDPPETSTPSDATKG
ncbi:hypothetical protein E2320_003322 [Naja naja]|nr:hypothetical protein E2320_003322 [Naja naja]